MDPEKSQKAKSGDTDQTAQDAQSDLGLRCSQKLQSPSLHDTA